MLSRSLFVSRCLNVWVCMCSTTEGATFFHFQGMFYFHKSSSFTSGVEKVWKHVSQVPVGWGRGRSWRPHASGWVGGGGGGAGVAIITRHVQWRDVICIRRCASATITASRASTHVKITALVVSVSPSWQDPASALGGSGVLTSKWSLLVKKKQVISFRFLLLFVNE